MLHYHTYQQRVIDEKAELDCRLEKLRSFLESDTLKELQIPEQLRLADQEIHMTSYSNILGMRIKAFANPGGVAVTAGK